MISENVSAPDLRVVSKGATAAEVAAVTAVLTAALDELAAQGATEEPAITAWQRSQRPMRAPIHPAPGAWRDSFH